MQNMKKRLVIGIMIFFIVILFSNIAEAVTLKGEIYDPNLEILENVIIDVNSTPKQFYVAKNGKYTFNLNPGSYLIDAKYYQGDILEYYGEEEITIISGEGEFIVDFILLPIEEEKLFEDYPELEGLFFEKERSIFGVISSIVIFVFLLGIILYLYLRKKGLIKSTLKHKEELSEDLKNLIDIIKKNDGRINQKELRKNLPYSEAKVSLIIAELESRGVVKKIKQGRGNIILLRR